jgi:hypothetical protein
MKAKVPILLYFLYFFFVILIFGCQREKKEFRCVITTYYEPFKCVITTYYEPISHNGEWVCGKEHIGTWKEVFPDTTFYDEYDNVMLKIINLEHTRKIVNNTYFSPKEKKLMKQNVWCMSNWDEKPEEGIIDFIRNEKGLLVERKIYGEINNYLISDIVFENPVIYKYDDTGRRIEAIETENTRKETIKYLPEDKGLLVVTSQVIDSNVKYYYQNTKGLVEQNTWIYDSKSLLLQRKIQEYYKYGYFNHKIDITYSYNKENQLIREYSKKEYAEIYTIVPSNLRGEKLDKFMEDEFSKITDDDHEYDNSISNREYNGYGDIISITDSTQTIFRNRHKQSDTNSILDAIDAWNNEYQRKWSERVNKYEYEYNKKNDWTKRVTLGFRYSPFNTSDATLQENGGKYVADLICVRKILYGEEARVLYDKYITIENSINKSN